MFVKFWFCAVNIVLAEWQEITEAEVRDFFERETGSANGVERLMGEMHAGKIVQLDEFKFHAEGFNIPQTDETFVVAESDVAKASKVFAEVDVNDLLF